MPPGQDDWQEYQNAQREWVELDEASWSDPSALRRTAYMNRLMQRIVALEDVLRAQSSWPQRVEVLLRDQSPGMRLAGALELARWDPARALSIVQEIERGPASGASWAAKYAVRRLRGDQPSVRPVTPAPQPAASTSKGAPSHPATVDSGRMALAEAVLAVHGAIMGGGFVSALDVAGDRVAEAIRGYEAIGLLPVVDLLRKALNLLPDGVLPDDANERRALVESLDDAAIDLLDTAYARLVPSDEVLGEHVDAYLSAAGGAG